MATYDLEEQEQIAEIKAWWKQYGNLVVNVLTGAAVIVIAWQGWNFYQRSQSAQASMVFNAVQKSIRENDAQGLKGASGELVEKFGGTEFAKLGALAVAKSAFEAGDLKTAKAQLAWVAEKGKNEVRDLARLRLAAVLLDEKAYDEAIKQLSSSDSQTFAARFAEGRGDILAAQGKAAEARSAYQSALTQREETEKLGTRNSAQDPRVSAVYREILQQKMDALGGAN